MSFFEGIKELTNDCKLLNILLYTALSIGIFKITTFSLSFSSLIFDIFLKPSINYKKYGAVKSTKGDGKGGAKWAVVTGASDGIGKEYAKQLASKGFNILLISRTQSKLEILSEEISSEFKVETKTLAIDFSTDKPSNYELISQFTKNLPITILINNVGQSHSIPVPFLQTQDEELRNIITINNISTLKTTQIIAPIIQNTIKSSKGIRGLILTMGSFGGLLPTPYLATYSGSKAFLQNWSSALSGELKNEGIDVELIISYLVTSSMSKIKYSSATIPNPKQFVKSVLSSVGSRSGAQERYATSTPYWTHALMHFGIENTVGIYSKFANGLNFNMHKSIRIRALKKQARLEAEAKKQ
ncbi:3-ketoacyl-CoA reductase [Wickerhamomyces ciferrii]|uniref:Very-long-chain 3-oxoacyl-CoA reductase n=1 Tax=Wickerhamomyces ciferrii (strain ATCC 14091 / BCRC 22168 / CBS 111 / JCM 3599 / NBRC 0793 / NRRL Y-1031 F-60-10) TaxID=1206466 RepID=K0KJR7_WICCF|nr:3-ketoacyl-CoA reductase [Wickerhamomyces ciferrii]CCH41714.1 3-ketoacyl-CoA reductase [Wickerhamomyces ciferrii]